MKSSNNAELNPKYSDSLKTLSVCVFTLFLGRLYVIYRNLSQSCTLNTWNFLWVYPIPFCLTWFFNSYYLPRLRTVRLLHLSCARDTDFVQLTYEIYYFSNIIFFFFAIFWLVFFFSSLYFMDEQMDFSIKITLENFVKNALARTLCENMICQSF